MSSVVIVRRGFVLLVRSFGASGLSPWRLPESPEEVGLPVAPEDVVGDGFVLQPDSARRRPVVGEGEEARWTSLQVMSASYTKVAEGVREEAERVLSSLRTGA